MLTKALRPRLLLTLLLVAASGGAAAQRADPSSEFAAAEAAFQAGDYAHALELFDAARAAGSTGPAVEYNTGVCQYKLGDFEAAVATFGALAERFPEMRELARYNRGLALLKLGRDTEAAAEFEVARTSSDPAIARLAAERLGGEPGAAPPPPAWSGLATIAVGHDDDVALVDELSLPAGFSAASPFTEALAAASRRFGSVPLRLDLSGYFVRYPDAGDYDQDALRVGLAALRTPGEWRVEAGPYFDYDTLGGDGFEQLRGAAARARRTLGARTRIDLRFAVEDVSSLAPLYDYIEGSRRLLRATVEQAVGRARWRFGYGLETNSRADASVSPRRNRWAIDWLRSVDDWSFEGSLVYRTSRYSGVGRNEDLKELSAAARRSLAHGWYVEATYRRSDNDSSDPIYSYLTNRFGVGVGMSF